MRENELSGRKGGGGMEHWTRGARVQVILLQILLLFLRREKGEPQ